MNAFQKIFDSVSGAWIGAASFVLVGFLLSRIDVAKIKINPWSAIRKAVGDFFVKEQIDRIDKFETEIKVVKENVQKAVDLLQTHVRDSNRRNAERARRHILAFEREIQWDVKHSKEEFEDVLETVQRYEDYCAAHPDFKNHVAGEATNHIKEVYRERLRKHDFAPQGGKTHE